MHSWREDTWKFIPHPLGMWPHVLFPFADSTLYLFTVINYGYECDSVLSPGSPSTTIIPPGDCLKGSFQHFLVQESPSFLNLLTHSNCRLYIWCAMANIQGIEKKQEWSEVGAVEWVCDIKAKEHKLLSGEDQWRWEIGEGYYCLRRVK